MQDSRQTLTGLYLVFDRWQKLLASKSESEITAPSLQDGWSIKDVMGHLRAWQQLSIARLEAGQSGGELVLPEWLQGQDPDEGDDAEDFNARIYEIYHSQPWAQVHKAWRDGFLHFLELGEAIPEQTLRDSMKYPRLKGYSLHDVLYWSGEHHQEHLNWLTGKP